MFSNFRRNWNLGLDRDPPGGPGLGLSPVDPFPEAIGASRNRASVLFQGRLQPPLLFGTALPRLPCPSSSGPVSMRTSSASASSCAGSTSGVVLVVVSSFLFSLIAFRYRVLQVVKRVHTVCPQGGTASAGELPVRLPRPMSCWPHVIPPDVLLATRDSGVGSAAAPNVLLAAHRPP